MFINVLYLLYVIKYLQKPFRLISIFTNKGLGHINVQRILNFILGNLMYKWVFIIFSS